MSELPKTSPTPIPGGGAARDDVRLLDSAALVTTARAFRSWDRRRIFKRSPVPFARLVAWLVPLLFLVTTTLPAQAPPAGRDWFVRAGAAGGDGSREKPFADPWQALAACQASDRIHVAEGRYFGRMGAGTWAIRAARRVSTASRIISLAFQPG